jgi:Tol biopolymer transport system component
LLVVERMVGDKQPDLVLMRPDGTGVQRLTATRAWEGKPEWSGSADGRRILLEIATAHPNGRQGHAARQSDLAVVDADGSHFRRLTRTAAIESMAVWSPDSKRIAFAGDRQVKGTKDLPRGGRSFEIYTMSANGTHVRRITHNHVPDLYPTWQPLGGGVQSDHR